MTATELIQLLRDEAEKQPQTRRGVRWARELHRAASTAEILLEQREAKP